MQQGEAGTYDEPLRSDAYFYPTSLPSLGRLTLDQPSLETVRESRGLRPIPT
jgi:hypothetical protein